jgi:hypothetical protein
VEKIETITVKLQDREKRYTLFLGRGLREWLRDDQG